MPGSASAEAVVAALRESGRTLAVAESLTGGALLSTLIGVPGASEVIRGGVVAYQNAVKTHTLGVSAAELEARGAVSEAVAVQMAQGVRVGLESGAVADFAVATTGVAGPDPDPDTGLEPGRVWIAVVGPKQTWTRQLDVEGNRERIRQTTVGVALEMLAEAIASGVRE